MLLKGKENGAGREIEKERVARTRFEGQRLFTPASRCDPSPCLRQAGRSAPAGESAGSVPPSPARGEGWGLGAGGWRENRDQGTGDREQERTGARRIG
jgi:hypothetical protein